MTLESVAADRADLARILDTIPLLVASCDRDGRYTHVNYGYAARFGRRPSELIGLTMREVVGPDVFAQVVPLIDRVLAGERVETEMTLTYPDAGVQTLRSVLTPVRDASGAVAGWDGVGQNITVQRDAEARLRDFAFLVRHTSDFIGLADLDFRPFFLNAAARRMSGIGDDDISRLSVFDFIAPEHHQFLRDEFFPQVLREGRATAEMRFRHLATGETFWMEYSVVRMEDDQQRPTGYATISRNLAEHKRVEALLSGIASDRALALARFRELADSMPQIVWSANAAGVNDYYNRRWYARTGTSSPGDADSMTFVHPDDRPICLDKWRAAFEAGATFELEYRMRFPGEPDYRWYLGRVLPVRSEAGAIVRWYGTATDIDDQKRVERALGSSQERLLAALEASETGTFLWDMRTNDLDWDENLDRLFGLAPGFVVPSLPEFIRLVHPDDRDRVAAACERCSRDGADFAEEFRVVWPDGTTHWVYDKGRTHRGPGGQPEYMAGACVDVTERRRKEDALRAADRQKDEFLGMLAHELRNPLAPLVYAVASLERRAADPSMKRPLEIMGRQVARISRLVDDLLDISRVTQGKIALQREPLDLGAVLLHAIDVVRPALEHAHHAIAVDLDDDVNVSGDVQRLGQVFENLLGNAVKYTPREGRIAVRLRREGDHAVVRISDNGIGIPADVLPRVFELFVQADGSLDRAQGGLGIGLTLVDRLTRLHGGSVTAISGGANRGSEFVVRLPLLGMAAEAAPDTEASGAPVACGRRILIVEDNADLAETMAGLLEINGHVVRAVNDGRTAVAAAHAFAPDAMLVDLAMPGMSGFDIVREIRRSPALADIVVVATTGYGGPDDRARSEEAGFTHHLTKPIDIDEVERLVMRAPRRS